MSYWNYRIVRYHDAQAGYGLHEVHYNETGHPVAMTAHSASFSADPEEGPQSIIKMLQQALKDAQERGVLDEPPEWVK